MSKLLVDVDVVTACDLYQNETFRGLKCKRLQLDEIWSFCAMKEKNVPPNRRGVFGKGDTWTWVAIDAEFKLALLARGTAQRGIREDFH